jgi:hypothetical protein
MNDNIAEIIFDDIDTAVHYHKNGCYYWDFFGRNNDEWSGAWDRRCWNGLFENVYDKARYCTLCGKKLPTIKQIQKEWDNKFKKIK